MSECVWSHYEERSNRDPEESLEKEILCSYIVNLIDDVAELKKHLVSVTAERDRLRGQVERLTAPVSDKEEVEHFSLIHYDHDCDAYVAFRLDVDCLIAARAALAGEEAKG